MAKGMGALGKRNCDEEGRAKSSGGKQRFCENNKRGRRVAMKKMAQRLWAFLWIGLLAVSFAGVSKAENRLEQVTVLKPTVVAYYEADKGEGPLEATLAGNRLEMVSDDVFEESGEILKYVVLLDISASIPESQFNDVKTAIIDFLRSKRSEDQLLLYTFGDGVNLFLDGSEDVEDAVNKIRDLRNDNQNTVLFEAMRTACDMVFDNLDKQGERFLVSVISDGKDFADTSTAEDVERLYTERGISVYTYAVENKEGDSPEQIRSYRDKFASIANNTGGMAWDVSQGESFADGIKRMREMTLKRRRAEFMSSDTTVSNQNEDFEITFPDGTRAKRTLLVNKRIVDNQKPTLKVSVDKKNRIDLAFSEPVLGADNLDNYSLKVEDKKIALKEVKVKGEPRNHEYRLLAKSDLKNGDYTLTVSNVTDSAEEKNPLKKKKYTFSVTDRKEDAIDHTAPKVVNAYRESDSTIAVSFSEEMSGADEAGNYTITKKGKTLSIIDVSKSYSVEYTYYLTVDGFIGNGDYAIDMTKDVTDASEEKNKLSDASYDLTVSGVSTVGQIFNLLKRYWFVLLGVLILVAALLAFLLKRRKKPTSPIARDIPKTPTYTSDKPVTVEAGFDTVGFRPGQRPAVLWMGDLGSEPVRYDINLTDHFIVGRFSENCAFRTDDRSMSREHFVLSLKQDGTVTVEDLKSTNGTFLREQNHRVLAPEYVHTGDTIFAGRKYFILEF